MKGEKVFSTRFERSKLAKIDPAQMDSAEIDPTRMRDSAKIDPERMRDAGEPAAELFDLICSIPGLPQREQLDLSSQLGKIKLEAAALSSLDEPFDNVEERFKYFVSLATEVPQLLLTKRSAADISIPLTELRKKIEIWAGPYHWRKVALRKAS